MSKGSELARRLQQKIAKSRILVERHNTPLSSPLQLTILLKEVTQQIQRIVRVSVRRRNCCLQPCWRLELLGRRLDKVCARHRSNQAGSLPPTQYVLLVPVPCYTDSASYEPMPLSPTKSPTSRVLKDQTATTQSR